MENVDRPAQPDVADAEAADIADAGLTTHEAAELLNVSMPHLIGLLDAGEIEYSKVGEHRRVQAGPLLDYKREDDQARREVADELTKLNQGMDLY